MKTKTNSHVLQDSVVRVALVTMGMLLIPAVVMQFSSEWDWNGDDFVIMGILIFSTGLVMEWVRKSTSNHARKIALIVAIILAFLYAWAELAVGIFTNLGS